MPGEEDERPLLAHLEELRRVLVVSAAAIGVSTAIVYGFFRDRLYSWVTLPLQEYNVQPVFIGLGEAFMTQIKLALAVGFALALPVLLWQLGSFILPALKPEEKRTLRVMVPLAVLLFATGSAFAYFAVFRYAARFLLLIGGECLQPMISIGQYVSFLISFLIPFGLAFELPLAVYLLARWGVVSAAWLAKNRKFAVVLVFVLAAALTPGPDIISQLLMAVPVLLLYEVSVWLARVAGRKREKAEAEPTEA